MAENKTQPTDASVAAFIASQKDAAVQADCQTLLALMSRATGAAPKMWGSNIVGFGDYHYVYDSGREGDTSVLGFSPRKTNLTLYMMGGGWKPDLLLKLGKHSTGVGCLYIKRLSDVDMTVLKALLSDAVKQAQSHAKATAARLKSGAPKRVPKSQQAPKVTVRNPNSPKWSANVDAAHYNAMKKVLLTVLPKKAPGLNQAEMMAAVLKHLPDDLFPGGSTAGWWMKCAQLDLEAQGAVIREASKPLRWHRK
jgi:hypothetical protein